MTQADICQRTFQSKQTVNLIIKNLLSDGYVTVNEMLGNKRNKIVRMTQAGPRVLQKGRPAYNMGGGYGNVHVFARGTKTAH